MELIMSKLKDVTIPHTHAAGEDGKEIPLYVRIPRGAKADKPVPVLLLMTGLDGHRPGLLYHLQGACSLQSLIKIYQTTPSVATNSSPVAGPP